MNRLRRITIAAIAAVTVVVGSHAMAPAALALPRSCAQVQAIVNMYWATGWAWYSIGDYVAAYYWWGKAEGLASAGCEA